MGYKVLLDANLLLDFLLKRNNFLNARSIIASIIEGKISGFVTPSIVHIVGYWLTKAYGSQKAKDLLLNLLTEIEVIDTSHEMTIIALNSKIKDIEDALQYYAALSNQLDYLISSDKDFQKAAIPSLPVISPEYFLSTIMNSHS
ncbi:putative nucleic acid-binding protein [Pedobacter sp. UYP24]